MKTTDEDKEQLEVGNTRRQEKRNYSVKYDYGVYTFVCSTPLKTGTFSIGIPVLQKDAKLLKKSKSGG